MGVRRTEQELKEGIGAKKTIQACRHACRRVQCPWFSTVEIEMFISLTGCPTTVTTLADVGRWCVVPFFICSVSFFIHFKALLGPTGSSNFLLWNHKSERRIVLNWLGRCQGVFNLWGEGAVVRLKDVDGRYVGRYRVRGELIHTHREIKYE